MLNYPTLENLNANRARLAVLDVEIPKLRRLADKLQNDTYLGTCRYDPTGGIHAEGRHSDPTASQASRDDLPQDVRQLLEDIRALTIERHRTASWVELAESALAFLDPKDRIIVKVRAVDQLSWEEVLDAVFDETGDLHAVKTIRARYDRAMKKIAPFFTADAPAQPRPAKRPYYRTLAVAMV